VEASAAEGNQPASETKSNEGAPLGVRAEAASNGDYARLSCEWYAHYRYRFLYLLMKRFYRTASEPIKSKNRVGFVGLRRQFVHVHTTGVHRIFKR
jgi:hypothetical protein